MRREKRTKRQKININGIILCVLVFFVIAGTVFCMAVSGRDEKKEAAAEQFIAGESSRAEMVKDFTETMINRKREEAFSVRPGRKIGVENPTDDKKVVYLTFDDGPSENTKKILDILKQYNARATFFITGANKECRPYIKEAYDAGHTIGLHTYTHKYSEVYASEEAYFEDLERVGKVAEEQIGYVPCFIRFPGGSSNTVSAKIDKGIMTKLVGKVWEKGYQYYDWNVDSGDGENKDWKTIETRSMTEGINHVMILCHDSQSETETVEALPSILEYYKERGYQFEGIDTASYVCHHDVKN